MNANDMVAEAAAATRREHAKRQAAFLQALQQAVATAEPARLIMLLKIGAGIFSESTHEATSMLLALATADEKYEPLLASYRELLRPLAKESVERSATALAPFSTAE
jgi:putative NADH-flavin reductase